VPANAAVTSTDFFKHGLIWADMGRYGAHSLELEWAGVIATANLATSPGFLQFEHVVIV
jgi:hypothetical protein